VWRAAINGYAANKYEKQSHINRLKMKVTESSLLYDFAGNWKFIFDFNISRLFLLLNETKHTRSSPSYLPRKVSR
jgi:hypothetical protein